MNHIKVIEKELEKYFHNNMKFNYSEHKWTDDNGTRVPDFIVKLLFSKYGANDTAFILAEMSITH